MERHLREVGVKKIVFRTVMIGILLLISVVPFGCEKRPGSLEQLEGKTLGVVVTVEEAKWEGLGKSLVAYLQKQLKNVRIKDTLQIERSLARYDFAATEAYYPEALQKLREDLGIDYLLMVNLLDINAGSTTASVEVGTRRTSISTAVNTTVTLVYTLYNAENGEEITAGEEVGLSDKVVDVKLGNNGSRFGLRVTRESELVREALLDAVKKTGWF